MSIQGIIAKHLVKLELVDSELAPLLNLYPQNLSQEMIRIAPKGNGSNRLKGATKSVVSLEMYQVVECTVSINKIDSIALNWIDRYSKNNFIGDVKVYTDSSVLPSLIIKDCNISNILDMNANGEQLAVKLVFSGDYYINTEAV